MPNQLRSCLYTVQFPYLHNPGRLIDAKTESQESCDTAFLKRRIHHFLPDQSRRKDLRPERGKQASKGCPNGDSHRQGHRDRQLTSHRGYLHESAKVFK
jgi:hypothetical protein